MESFDKISNQYFILLDITIADNSGITAWNPNLQNRGIIWVGRDL